MKDRIRPIGHPYIRKSAIYRISQPLRRSSRLTVKNRCRPVNGGGDNRALRHHGMRYPSAEGAALFRPTRFNSP